MSETKKKSFKDYYQNQEFRKRHQEYIKTKITCDCGKTFMRVNWARHRKSEQHKRWEKQQRTIEEDIMKLKETVKQLEERLGK